MIPINFGQGQGPSGLQLNDTCTCIYRPNLVQMMTTDRIYLSPSNSVQIFICKCK